MNFTELDIFQIEKKGISISQIEKQLKNYLCGFPHIKIIRPATISDGIKQLENKQYYIDFFEKHSEKREVTKFVPASGAASRMFKHLIDFRNKILKEGFDIDEIHNLNKDALEFINNIKKFAFYDNLKTSVAENGFDIDSCLSEHQYVPIINSLLEEIGLNYNEKPKALIKFHHYGSFNRLAIEEHLVEGIHYVKDKTKNVRIHFTVSPEHKQLFISTLDGLIEDYENAYSVKFDISYSVQKPSTDTIAVDLNNNFFRNDDGSLLFRPGGHGALIENLNDLLGDIVFIKNIDNVVPEFRQNEIWDYKKVLGGYLIEIQSKIFSFLRKLEDEIIPSVEIIEIESFINHELGISLSLAGLKSHEIQTKLFDFLNRPIRICGMVPNCGEPGGGPFWIEDEANIISLQIVESSQVNFNNKLQKEIFSKSTHFNPVDLVCGLKDFKGDNFHLPDFVDPATGMISVKSFGGKELKAQELPGLWNGAMANWITIFVQVPLSTFNPVKSVNDLLRNEHLLNY